MAHLSVPRAPERAADWVPRLIAQQLTGLREVALRSAVARGAVRIRPAPGGRYLYSVADCERLRREREAVTTLHIRGPRPPVA